MGVCLIAGVKLGVVGYPTPPFPEGLTQAESLNYQDPGTKQLEQVSSLTSFKLPPKLIQKKTD